MACAAQKLPISDGRISTSKVGPFISAVRRVLVRGVIHSKVMKSEHFVGSKIPTFPLCSEVSEVLLFHPVLWLTLSYKLEELLTLSLKSGLICFGIAAAITLPTRDMILG